MASEIAREHIGPLDKPIKPKPNRRKREWLRTRRMFLQDKKNWLGTYNCERCGNHTRNPEVDHIKKRSTHPGLIHEHSNLMILCDRCHRLKHM